MACKLTWKVSEYEFICYWLTKYSWMCHLIQAVRTLVSSNISLLYKFQLNGAISMNLQFCVPKTKTKSVYSKALAECLVQSDTLLGTWLRIRPIFSSWRSRGRNQYKAMSNAQLAQWTGTESFSSAPSLVCRIADICNEHIERMN